MKSGKEIELARGLAKRVESWAKHCVVFMTDAAAAPDETEADVVLREYGLSLVIFMGLAVLSPTITILAERADEDDVVYRGIVDEMIKDYRTVDQRSLMLKLKTSSERVGKWIAKAAGLTWPAGTPEVRP